MHIHHSVYAFNGTRNPKARSEDARVLDFVNNELAAPAFQF
jgi:hypothetical protein